MYDYLFIIEKNISIKWSNINPSYTSFPTHPWNETFTKSFSLFSVVLIIAFLLLLGLLVLVGRHFTVNKGDYKTCEAKDSQYYDNPDFAIASASTGQPEVQKKKEWFI